MIKVSSFYQDAPDHLKSYLKLEFLRWGIDYWDSFYTEEVLLMLLKHAQESYDQIGIKKL